MNGRIGSLCSGYEGLGMAVQSVLGGELAWVADNDPGAAKILAHRYPDVPNHGDITAVDWAEAEPVSILTAGFPCTDVSCAGARAGLREGTRSGVWTHCARAISELRPSLVVIENVRGLLSAGADSPVEPCPWCLGETRDEHALRAAGAVLGDLADIGYDAEWTTVSAADAGAPHRRERIFIVARPAADTQAPGWWRRGGTRSAQPHPGTGESGRLQPEPDDRGEQPPADAAGARRGGGEDAGTGGGCESARVRRVEPERVCRASASADADSTVERAVAMETGRSVVASVAGLQKPRRDRDGQYAPAEDTDRAASGERRLTGPGEAESGRSWADAGGSGGALVAYSEHDGLAASQDAGTSEGSQQRQRGSRWVAAEPAGDGNQRIAWGAYELAIRRWERVVGRPAPRPTEPGRTRERLSPRFVEWMMGLPDGWVTDVPGLSRNAQLKALGNGVVPQQAAMALRMLLARTDAQEAA